VFFLKIVFVLISQLHQISHIYFIECSQHSICMLGSLWDFQLENIYKKITLSLSAILVRIRVILVLCSERSPAGTDGLGAAGFAGAAALGASGAYIHYSKKLTNTLQLA
jgi:hypothetical protein